MLWSTVGPSAAWTEWSWTLEDSLIGSRLAKLISLAPCSTVVAGSKSTSSLMVCSSTTRGANECGYPRIFTVAKSVVWIWKILRADINSDSDRDFEKLADMDMDTNISLNSYMDIYIYPHMNEFFFGCGYLHIYADTNIRQFFTLKLRNSLRSMDGLFCWRIWWLGNIQTNKFFPLST